MAAMAVAQPHLQAAQQPGVPPHMGPLAMLQPVPMQQQYLKPMGPAAQQLPTSFMAQQSLGLMAPFQQIIGDGSSGGYGLLSNTPAMTQYQPMLVHQIGATAANQRLFAGSLMQRQHQQLEGLLMPTAPDGTIMSAVGPGVGHGAADAFHSFSAAAMGASHGDGAEPRSRGGGCSSDAAAGAAVGAVGGGGGSKKGKQGSRRLLKPEEGDCPTLATFASMGGLPRVRGREGRAQAGVVAKGGRIWPTECCFR